MSNNVHTFNASEIERKVHEQLTLADVPPVEMLTSLRMTRSIISGSTVLPVLLDVSFIPNDLDVYTTEAGELRMLSDLQHKFGFSRDHTNGNQYDSHAGILRIHWLAKGTHSVNLIVVPSGNAATAIFYFHSTIVMNYISGFGVFSAYPALTLEKKAIPNAGIWSDKATKERAFKCFPKYVGRGIEYREDLGRHKGWEKHKCGTDKSCPTTLRALHDGGSLFIPFPSVNLPDIEAPIYDGIRSVIWSLGGKRCAINAGEKQVYTMLFVTSQDVVRAVSASESLHSDQR